MAQNRLQITLIFIFGLLLTGCFEDPKIVQDRVNQLERARAELEQKKELYDIKYAEQRAEDDKIISYMEGQAGLVKGCEILINICPSSIKSNGIKAIEEGYGGGLSYSFWLIFISKMATMSFVVGGVAFGAFVAYEIANKKFGLKELTESLRAAKQADAKLAASQASLQKAETEIEQRKHQISALKNDETIIQNSIKTATNELKKLEAELAEKQEAKRMLSECF